MLYSNMYTHSINQFFRFYIASLLPPQKKENRKLIHRAWEGSMCRDGLNPWIT